MPPQANNDVTTGGVRVVESNEQKDAEDGMCRNITNTINSSLENFFARVGLTVARNPWKVVLISLVVSAFCLVGVLELQTENRGEKNWVSQSSDPIKHKDWIDEVFPIPSRTVNLLLEKSDSGDLLTRDGLLTLYETDQKVRAMYNGTAKRQWSDICYSPGDTECVPSSILEIWSYNFSTISSLSDEAIKTTVNNVVIISPMTGRVLSISFLVGGIERSQNGTILSASALKADYRLKKNDVFQQSSGRSVDENADKWEEELEKTFEKSTSDYIVYTFSKWSNEDAASKASNGDLQFFVFGYILVIIYLSTMMGSFSRIGHKIFLSLAGIGVIGISIGISYGLGSAFQLKYTGVHNVLPFLLLGIGVDDLFVIVQSWENVGGPKQDHRSIPEKISLAIRHAGVSVLVTSVTDICAFAIGSATILPALRSFSIWCAIGILAIFLLTITLFTALLTLDAKRQEKERDACLCCLKLPSDYQPLKCSEKNILKTFLKEIYSPIVLSTPGKIIILLVTAGLLGTGIYGLTELEQNFDFIWFLPSDSRPRVYVEKNRIAFPSNGITGNVYLGQIDYYNGKEQMDKVKTSLDNNPWVAKGSVNSWYHHYHEWTFKNHLSDMKDTNCSVDACKLKSEILFYQHLQTFLLDKEGKNYQRLLIFNTEKKIRASKMSYTHTQVIGSVEEVKAMDSVTEVIKPGFITDGGEDILPFAFTRLYINFSTNKVISTELIRNISLATGCVLLVTLFLLSNLLTSLMVLACVVFSLVEIAAFMGFWGLTIDTVTTIILVIAIGLTVDYSVHIAHGFMVSRAGDRNARSTEALHEVGPAVFHGGFSTFLAFALLAASQSYVFLTFFKVFFLVVLFGMFQGMFFLPVILSLIGPAPYAKTIIDVHNRNNGKVADDAERGRNEGGEKTAEREHEMRIVVEQGSKNKAYTPE